MTESRRRNSLSAAEQKAEQSNGKIHYAFYRSALREKLTDWENSKTPCGLDVKRMRSERPQNLTRRAAKVTCARCASTIKIRDNAALGLSGHDALKDFEKAVRGIARGRGWKYYSNLAAREGFPTAVMVRDGDLIFAHLTTAVSREPEKDEFEWASALGAAAESLKWKPNDLQAIKERLK